jgi:hypothetical protein
MAAVGHATFLVPPSPLNPSLNPASSRTHIATRAITVGVPFVPEKDGKVFLPWLLGDKSDVRPGR